MNITEIIGYFAALLAALIFLPQMLQTIRSKNTNGLSLPTFILVTLSNSMWLSYGVLTLDSAIILSQIFLFPMGITILVYKIKYG